jgi:hypothetical protein
LALYGADREEEARRSISLLASADVFDDALVAIVNDHFGVSGAPLRRILRPQDRQSDRCRRHARAEVDAVRPHPLAAENGLVYCLTRLRNGFCLKTSSPAASSPVSCNGVNGDDD